jgi:preprotein translocase subunit SecY
MLQQIIRTLFSKQTLYEQFHGPRFWARVWNTLALVMAFRIFADIPLLNVDDERMQQLLAGNPLLGLVNLLAGGDVLTHFSLVAAGIFPYLMARLLVSGVTWVLPPLRTLRREGSSGAAKLEQQTKLWSIPLAFLFAVGAGEYFAHQPGLFHGSAQWFTAGTFFTSLWIVCLVTLGSVLSTWITHLITRIGVGAGEQVVLVVGASITLANQISSTVRTAPSAAQAIKTLGWGAVVAAALVYLSYCLLNAQRRLPYQDSKRAERASRLSSSDWKFIPLPVLVGGNLPISGAVGLLVALQFTQTFLASHFGGMLGAVGRHLGAWLAPQDPWFWIAMAALVALLTYLFNFSILWQSKRDERYTFAEQLKRDGIYFPGIRPGQATEVYLAGIIARITPLGALGAAFLAVGVPYMIFRLTQLNCLTAVLSLIIIVKAIQDLSDQISVVDLDRLYGRLMKSRRGRIRQAVDGNTD